MRYCVRLKFIGVEGLGAPKFHSPWIQWLGFLHKHVTEYQYRGKYRGAMVRWKEQQRR